MNKKVLNIWRWYQKIMWYAAQAGNEIGKPMRFYSETALLILLLDKFGMNLTWQQVVISYAVIITIAVLLGRYLARVGTIKYITHLNNIHNEDLQTIIKKINCLEKKVDLRG